MELLIKFHDGNGKAVLDENSSKGYQRIDFSNHLNTFGPGSFLHKSKQNIEKLSNLVVNDPKFLADILASQIAADYNAGVLKDDFDKQALRCCRDILKDQGFKDITTEKLRDCLLDSADIIVAIVGCQNWNLLEQRVKAAVRVCEPLIQLRRNITICFSGSHPDRDRVAIPNEAEEMQMMFDNEITRQRLKRIANLFYRTITESRSNTTESNVRNIAQKINFEPSKRYSFFLVSSSFHIPRLYAEFEKQILCQPSINRNEPRNQIEHIVLVGAEGFVTSRKSYSPSQVKLLMYEIFQYLMGNEQFKEHLGIIGEINKN